MSGEIRETFQEARDQATQEVRGLLSKPAPTLQGVGPGGPDTVLRTV